MMQIGIEPYFRTDKGAMFHNDSLDVLKRLPDNSVDLIMTSPPFGLIKKKKYGNEDSTKYLDWFRPFAKEAYRVLKSSGSFVIDIGGSWNKGTPTRSLYHFKLLIMLCEEFKFFLAQEYYWWNPSKLPTPAEWVNIRRVRVKDAVNTVWWLSKTEYPKANNRRVLTPYSDSMHTLIEKGYKAKLRPSGHNISDKFGVDNGGSIPPNLLSIPNTQSNDRYTKYCKDNGLTIHPARFPSELPEYFIRMLTDEGDLVIDIFGGSCVTGAVSERLNREWICCELVEDYLKGAICRFTNPAPFTPIKNGYTLYNPSANWASVTTDKVIEDGGKERPKKS